MLQCVTDNMDSPTAINYFYNFLKGLVFFYFHELSGTRPGPILNLTFDQYAPLRRGEIVYSTEHKTGAQYAVKFKLTVKQIPWFDRMYEAFRKETGTEPAYLFPTTLNQKEKSIARFVKDSLYRGPCSKSNFFRGQCAEYCLHICSVRKRVTPLIPSPSYSNGTPRPDRNTTLCNGSFQFGQCDA